jgi:hypothetical protein
MGIESRHVNAHVAVECGPAGEGLVAQRIIAFIRTATSMGSTGSSKVRTEHGLREWQRTDVGPSYSSLQTSCRIRDIRMYGAFLRCALACEHSRPSAIKAKEVLAEIQCVLRLL